MFSLNFVEKKNGILIIIIFKYILLIYISKDTHFCQLLYENFNLRLSSPYLIVIITFF